MKPFTMLPKKAGGLLAVVFLVGIMGFIIVHAAREAKAGQETPATPAFLQPPRREISGSIDSPAISFIDSPSATCVRPSAGTGACYIDWSYLYVTAASSNYIISMTVSIDNQIRSYHAGFFQNSMYIPGDIIAPGFKVTCGAPGSGGKPGFGQSYSYTIRARETGGLTAANYGSVTCPADIVWLYLPAVLKN